MVATRCVCMIRQYWKLKWEIVPPKACVFLFKQTIQWKMIRNYVTHPSGSSSDVNVIFTRVWADDVAIK